MHAQAGHVQDQRNLFEANEIILHHRRRNLPLVLLLQPAQTPEVLHAALMIRVSGVGIVETLHDGEQVRVLRLEGRGELRGHAVLHAGEQLPLIDQIDVTAQRRRAPRILRDAQTFVRRGRRLHARALGARTAEAALRAVDARHAVIVEKRAPGRIRENREFRHDQVERRSAAARRDGDVLAFDVEIEVVVALHFALEAVRRPRLLALSKSACASGHNTAMSSLCG